MFEIGDLVYYKDQKIFLGVIIEYSNNPMYKYIVHFFNLHDKGDLKFRWEYDEDELTKAS